MKKKIISITNDYEYSQFLKKLKYYRIFLFNNTKFIIRGNYKKDEIISIILALNIKNKKERILFIYDTVCDLLNNQNKNLNICGFKNNKCLVQQKLKNNKCNGCCRLCRFQSENGCTTQNLTCKLFNCSEVKKRHNVLEYKDINILKLLSFKNRIIIKHDYFSLREDVLKDLYSPSLIFSFFRMLFRLIKNFLFLKNKKR